MTFGIRIQETRHRVFVSYYHKDDQRYRDALEKNFGSLFISKSVQPGEIASDNSSEYIKQLIQKDYLSDSSVVLVLIGPKSLCRRHVDWEISAGLNTKVGGYSGLMGILLPEIRLHTDASFLPSRTPARYADNVKSGYATTYTWATFVASADSVQNTIEKAFDAC